MTEADLLAIARSGMGWSTSSGFFEHFPDSAVPKTREIATLKYEDAA